MRNRMFTLLIASLAAESFATFAQVPPPVGTEALTAGDFIAIDPEDAAVREGLGEMILSDAFSAAEGPDFADCPIIIVSRKDRAAAEKEIALQQTEFFDPATRIEPGHLIDPTIMITGRTEVGSKGLDYVITLRRQPGGEPIGEVFGTVPLDELLTMSKEIADKVLAVVCPPGWTVSGGGKQMVASGRVRHIDVPFAIQGDIQGGTVAYVYTPEGPDNGTVKYALQGSGVGGGGAGAYTLQRNDDGSIEIDQIVEGCIAGMPNACRKTQAHIILTPVHR